MNAFSGRRITVFEGGDEDVAYVRMVAVDDHLNELSSSCLSRLDPLKCVELIRADRIESVHRLQDRTARVDFGDDLSKIIPDDFSQFAVDLNSRNIDK